MANPTDLKVRVSGELAPSLVRSLDRAASATDNYADSLKDLDLELRKVEKQLAEEHAKALQKQHDAMDRVGKGMLVAGAAIATGLGLAVNEAIKWESAWAGVTKVVDGSPEQMAALETELRGLAKTLPATHEEIAGVAEAAGQLGVQRQNIVEFTRTMVAMGVSTNLSADEAATGMARFSNIMGTVPTDVDRLGAAIVALGNDGASTEQDILDMSLRIAAAGKVAGFSESDVLALANSLSSLGIEAEAGGSAISTIMVKIDKAVVDSGEELEAFSGIAGMTAKQFADQWRKDPAAALLAFEEGLAGVEESGGNTFKVLEDLGITEIRQRGAVLALAQGHDLLAASLETGSEAWEENAALVEEANKRYETAESKLSVARNQLTDFAIDIGGVVLPAVAGAAEGFGDFLGAVQNLPGPVSEALAVLGTAGGAFALAGGAALVAIPKISELSETLTDLGIGGDKSSKALRGLAKAAAIAPVIVALGAAIEPVMKAMSSTVGTPIVDDIDDLSRALLRFGHDGKVTGELAKGFGEDFEGVTRRFRADGESFGEAAKRLSEATWADKLEGGFDAAGKSFKAMDESLATLVERGFIEQAGASFDSLAERAEKYGVAQKELLELFPEYKGALEDKRLAEEIAAETTGKTAKANEEATEWTKEYGQVSSDTAAEIADLEAAVDDLKDSLDLLNGESIEAEEAAIAFRDQIRSMKEAIEENGTSFKENTAAGDANRKMILDGIGAAERAAEAVFDKTVKEKGHEAAVRAANSSMRESIKTLRDEAIDLGIAEGKVDDYIAAQLGISPKEVTKYEAPGLAASLAQARELDATADSLDGRRVKTYFNTQHDTVYNTTYNRLVRGRQQALPYAGGPVSKYEPIIPMQSGGRVSGPGSGIDDSAGLFALSNGEYIIRQRMVDSFGTRFFDELNAGRLDLGAIKHGGRLGTGAAAASSSPTGGAFEGNLYLDSGQLLGLVRGEIRESNRDTRRRVGAGSGGIR